VTIDVKMGDGKRCKLNLPLFQPILPDNCTHEFLTTKVEISLKKGKCLQHHHWEISIAESISPTDLTDKFFLFEF